MSKTKFKKVSHLSTVAYELFNFLTFNRKTDEQHINKLIESMKMFGFIGVIQVIETAIIEGKKRLYIVDGQHRFMAAMRLGLPIQFQIHKADNKKELAELIAELNSSAKSWGTTQYLKVWSELGIEEYTQLKQVLLETGYQITPLVEIFTGQCTMREYRKGTMTFPNIRESRNIIKQMREIEQYMPTKAFCRRAIVRVMRMEGWNQKKMVKSIKNYVELMGGFTENEKDLRAQLITLMENAQ